MDTTTRLIEGLRNPAAYDHAVTKIDTIETHISWIVLTGEYAYKIKKPIKLDFLDYSTLDARAHYCDKELTLNRRLAPAIYLGVVQIGGTPEAPRMGGTPVLEYAIKMRQFNPNALALNALHKNQLTDQHWCRLAQSLARFHTMASSPHPSLGHGSPDTIQQQTLDNFKVIRTNMPMQSNGILYLNPLETWACRQIASLSAFWTQRINNGFVRECHGDLHLGNIALIENELVPFDAIEFSESLRNIDVISDLAFLLMDMEHQNTLRQANLLRNEYLDYTADYEGIKTLRFYQVYRALVRAKVAAIRLNQLAPPQTQSIIVDVEQYLALARRYTQPSPPQLLITNGLSGTGKSTLGRDIAARLGAIWIRSDRVRKQLAGLDRDAQMRAGIRGDHYSAAKTQAVYAKMRNLAADLLDDGYSVLVDATFLRRGQRVPFIDMATKKGIRIIIVHCHANIEVLRQRIDERASLGHDPSEATREVLDYQLKIQEPLSPEEIPFTISVDTHASFDAESIERLIRR